MAKREIEKESIYIVLLRREGFDEFFGKNTPYVRMAVASALKNSIADIVKQYWNLRMNSRQKGFKLFDVYLKAFGGDIDLSYIVDLPNQN